MQTGMPVSRQIRRHSATFPAPLTFIGDLSELKFGKALRIAGTYTLWTVVFTLVIMVQSVFLNSISVSDSIMCNELSARIMQSSKLLQTA
jgi:hypothetical protein